MKTWTCEQEVVVLHNSAPAGAEILGPPVGTTTKPLEDDKVTLKKVCNICKNSNPNLQGEHLKHMLSDQKDVGYEAVGGLRVA